MACSNKLEVEPKSTHRFVHRTSIEPKRFHPDTHRPHNPLTSEGHRMACAANWRWTQKHSRIVHRTSMDQNDPTPAHPIEPTYPLTWTTHYTKEKGPRMQSPSKKRNEPKTRYCGHPFSRLSRVWT